MALLHDLSHGGTGDCGVLGHRGNLGPLDIGAALQTAVKDQRISQTMGLPRDNH